MFYQETLFWSKQKDYKIDICCFSAKTGWLRIRIMCPMWSNMSTRGLLFQ